MVNKYLSSLLKSRSSLTRSHQGTESSSSHDAHSDVWSCATSVTSFDKNSIKKRPRSTIEGEDNKLEESDERRQQSKRPISSSIASDGKVLACPFSKRYPERYSNLNTLELQYRGCSSGFWTDISRLKQYLYRVHCRPDHYCPCCFEAFDNSDVLDKHSRQRNCAVKASTFADKVTKDQANRIKKKTPRIDKCRCWYNIYSILFPGTPMPQSPCAAETSTELLQSYDSFYRRKAPSRLAAIIESKLTNDASLEPPRLQLPHDLLEDSISELFQQLGNEFRPALPAHYDIDAPIDVPYTSYRTSASQNPNYVQVDSLPLIPASRLIPPVSFNTSYADPGNIQLAQPPTEWEAMQGNINFHQAEPSYLLIDFDAALAHLDAPFPDRTRLSYHSGIPMIEMYADRGDTGITSYFH